MFCANNVIHTFLDPTPIIIEIVRICKPNGKIEIKTHLPTGNNSSIIMIRGHTIGMMRGFTRENFGSYYFKEFSKGKDIGKIVVEKAEYYTSSNKSIMKGIIKLCNKLGWKFVEKSPLMYMFPWMSVRVIYRKEES
jgi:ubiquinone/menaquinone biosynthesis C-methylase UbiE